MILVTGGTGFVGSHLVKRLARENIRTRCLVRKNSRIAKLLELGIEVAYGDVNDKESLQKALEGVETVVHLEGIIVERKGATFEIMDMQRNINMLDTFIYLEVRS